MTSSQTKQEQQRQHHETLNLKPFFPKLLLSINQRCALTRRFYVQPKKYLGFCLDHFDSHARKLTSFLDDVTIFFLDQKSHLFSIFHPHSVLVSTHF